MLHHLLVDTFPILFRFLPNYLEISLVLLRKTLLLIELISVYFENKQELVKILLENVLLLVVWFALSSHLFKHVQGTIKWLIIFTVLIKVLKKSRRVHFLLL